MSPSTPTLLPVLIAGAGPVGLFEALLLTQLGIPVRIIDRELAISPYSRALGLHCRTMEILQFTGIIDSFLDKGKPMTNVSYYRNARLVGSLPVIQAPEQSRFSTGMFLEQAKTSEILLNKLKELGVEVEYGWELLDTKVVDGRDGEEEYVETAIRRALVGGHVVKGGEDKDYETQVVRSKYLVACDGGRSTVRHKINIAFPGRSLAQKILMWDGHCECDIPFTGPTAIKGPNGKTLFVVPLDEGIVRIGVEDSDLTPGEDFDKTLRDLTIEHFQSVVNATASPAKFKVTSTAWLTCFKLNERRADHFVHKNRIFLAGDAAHIHSPSGGQGMNTGLQDAHNLAWKLGYVLNGLAKPEVLLPTYEERGAMADRAIRVSSQIMARNRAQGVLADVKMYLVFLLAPLIARWTGSFFFSPEVAMLDVKYEKNIVNRPHETQPEPAAEHKVGIRAKDGILLPFYSTTTTTSSSSATLSANTKDKKDPQPTLRLHSLFTGVARFHILVFTSDQLTVDAKEISTLLDRHVTQWRSKWPYGSTLQDGYADKDLFKVYVIASPPSSASSAASNTALLEMSRREVGKGKVYIDSDGRSHKEYGFAPTKGQGGITVVRPDSHIGFRVHGVQEQSWKDVDAYFSSILVIQTEQTF